MVENNLPTNTEIDVNTLPKDMLGKTNKRIDLFKLIIIVILPIMVGSLVGGITGKLNSKEITKTQTYEITKPVNVFPISFSILQNPMLSDWSGRLKGRVRELKPSSFSISQIKEDFRPNGQIIVTDTNNPNLTEIEVVSGITKFFVSSSSSSFDQTPIPISYGQIQNNSILEGNVRIKYDSSLNSLKLTGVSFTLR